jgi:hypothetical protein
MGTNHSRVFDPLGLEIIDRVYDAALAQLEARDPFRDREKDDERQEALRELVFALATSGHVDFDTLFAKVVAHMPSMMPRSVSAVEDITPPPTLTVP